MKMKSKNNKIPIHGILLVNKPIGLTSNAVLQQVKKLFCAQKAGHTGSLDPLATGMLPICFGEATKYCQYLLDADKCYDVSGVLGIKTTTGDAAGEIISKTDAFCVNEMELKQVLQEFMGSTLQTPSMFSALKHQGTPLYRLARAGIEVERQAREIKINQIELHKFNGIQFDLTVECSKGTYIRNLVEDIGERLGPNAYVTRLHRCYTMGFADDPMFTMDELKDKSPEELMECLLPIDQAVYYFPKMNISGDSVIALRQGKVIGGISNELDKGIVRLYEDDKKFIGLGEVQSPGILKAKRLLTEEACKQMQEAYKTL
jgi:tRNA pseudouridine55 synthase